MRAMGRWEMGMFRTRVLWLMGKNKDVMDLFRVRRDEIMKGKAEQIGRLYE